MNERAYLIYHGHSNSVLQTVFVFISWISLKIRASRIASEREGENILEFGRIR